MTPHDGQQSGTVLVVDNLGANVELLRRLLTRAGHHVIAATDGETALKMMAETVPDLVLLDVVMPGLSGFEVCRRLKQNLGTRLIPVVLITALQDPADRVQGIEAGADDFLSKPFDESELRARVRSLISLKRYTDELDSAEQVIVSLALTIEARDKYTDGHCHRLAASATALGARLGLGSGDLEALRRGGFLHDLGKIAVPDAVLLKAGPLTDAERDVVRRHPVTSDELCGHLKVLRRVRPIVRHHHERLDGTGYPDGLRGDAIPLLAQIMSIVDVYDALTTDRPYRQAWFAGRACDELRGEARRGWLRADLVEEFMQLAAAGVVAPAAPPGLTADRPIANPGRVARPS